MIKYCVVLLLVLECNCARMKFSNLGQFHGSGPSIDHQMGIESQPCDTLQENSLTKILGAAFNPRYMSVNVPHDEEEDLQNVEQDNGNKKRKTSDFRPFSVDEDFANDFGEEAPAWEVDHFESDYFTNGRKKRSSESVNGQVALIRKRRSEPWQCKSTVKWIDLGTDYFPRYLRNVECSRHSCWYNRFQCRPRSFTVKILRKKKGKCAYVNKKVGNYGLPQELRELWVWEERAVNFCCECASP